MITNSRATSRWWRWPAWFFLTGSLVGMLLLQKWANDPWRVDSIYSKRFWLVWSRFWSGVFDWIPVSVGDLLYAVFLISLIAFGWKIAQSLVRKKWLIASRVGLNLLATLTTVYVLFMVSWGLNYHRPLMLQHFTLETVPPNLPHLLEVLTYHLEAAERIYPEAVKARATSDFEKVRLETHRAFERQSELSEVLIGSNTQLKAPIYSKGMSYLGVSGYFNPFTQEAHVNTDQPAVSIPFTACHELAHKMGVGFEDEANLIGYILTSSSDNPYFQYSGHLNVLWMLMNELYVSAPEVYFYYLNQMPEGILEDTAEIQSYWEAHTGWLNSLTTLFYTWFLKANQQPEGMDRYNRMVDLLLSWHFRHLSCG